MTTNSYIMLIALRYLRSRRFKNLPSLITSLSFLGISISVATLLIVMSVTNGFRVELIKRLIGMSAHVNLSAGGDKIIDNYDAIAVKLQLHPMISMVTPTVQGQGMVINSSNNSSSAILINGVSQGNFSEKLKMFKKFDGDINSFDQDDSIIIGHSLAKRLSMKNGDELIVVTPEVTETMVGILPRYKTFKVVGIVDYGMQQYDEVVAFTSLKAAQVLYHYENTVSNIEILLHKPQLSQSFISEIKSMPLLNGLYISDWQDDNDGIIQALKVEHNVMMLVLTLFVVVAVFSLFSSMTMLVNDKAKNIAIMRSMGISRLNIGLIFFTTGFVISFLGTLFGITVGATIAANIETIKNFLEATFETTLFNSTIYFLSNLPSEVRLNDVTTTGIVSIALSLIASVAPAIKATKYKPADALKYI